MYKELYDGNTEYPLLGTAVEQLNELCREHKCKVISYNVVRYEMTNRERTYILVEIIK